MSVTSWNSIRDFDPLHSVLQMIPDYIWLKDKAGVYLACNHAVTRLLGAKEEEIVGKTDYDFFDERVADAFHQKDEEAIAAKHILITEEWVTLQENNQLILLETRKVQVCDSNGEIVGILNVGRDITQPKHIEIERQRLIDIIEESVDFIGGADMHSNLLYHNRAAKRMVGLPDDYEMLEMTISDMHPEWALKLLYETAIPTVFSKGVWRGESALLHQKGYEIPVFQTIVFHRDEQGKPEFLSTIMQDITARKQKDERLALLDYAFNHINEAIFLIDENARFVQVNEKACSSLGYTREELLKLRVFDIDPDFTPEHWDNFSSAITDGTLSVIIETRHKTKDGRIFPVEVSANHIFYGSDGEHYDMAMVRDISERKETDKQLLLLNYALDHVGEAAWLIDENAQFHYNNAQACRALGYSREELLTLGVPNIDPDYQLDIWPVHWQDLKANGSLIFESRHRRRDGHIFPVEINANYFEFDGKGYNLALIRDITERKKAQEALQRSEASLAEAQRIAHIGSWEVDIVRNQLFWSDETFRIWEIDKSQFAATIEAFYETVHPEDRENVAKVYNESVENKTLYQVEHRLLFPDGRVKYIAERGEVQCDENGNSIRFVGTALDITEQQRVKDTLEFVAQRGWQNSNESFLVALTQYLAQVFGVDYVIIDKVGTPPTQAETVAIYVKGNIFPNMQYDLEGTPCNDVMNGKLCTHPKDVQQLFPDDILLVEMQVESYAAIPLWNTNGDVIGLIAVMDTKPMQDVEFITSILQLVATSVAAELERQRAEQVLLDSHHFLKQIVNTLANPVFVKDRAHRWVLLNQAFCEFIGYPREQLHGKSDYDFFPAYQADVFWAKDELVFTSSGENINEEEFTDAKGFLRTIITKKTCYTDSKGQQFLVGIITDITERKSMEDVLTAREREFRTLAENVPGILIRYDEKCRMRYINQILRKGCNEQDEWIGQTLTQIYPNDALFAELHEIIKRVIETGQSAEIERFFPHHQGGTTWVFNYTPESDDDGKIVGVLALGRDVTERKRMEDELAAREQQFRVLAETLPSPVFRFDKECRRIYMNPIAEKISGIPAEELLYKKASDSSPLNADELKKVEQTIQYVLDTGQPQEEEILFRVLSTEQIYYFHNSYAPEFDSKGEVTSVVVVSHNITERKHMEEIVRQREQEFRILVETSPSPIIRYDANCRRVYVNPAVEKMAGKTREELLAHRPTEGTLLSESVKNETEKVLRGVLETGQMTENEAELVLADGQTHYFYNRYAPELDANGKAVGIVLVGHDITARKQAENLLLQREQEFRTLVDNLPTVVIRYSSDLKRIYANRPYHQATGITEAEFADLSITEKWVCTNMSAEEYLAILANAVRTRENSEILLECPDAQGKLCYFETKIVPEYGVDGRVQSILVLGFDSTERHRQQIVESNRQLIFEKMAHGDDLDKVLEQVALYVESSKSGRYCGILLLDESESILQTVAAPSFPFTYFAKSDTSILDLKHKRCHGWLASVLSKERIIIEDIHTNSCYTLCESFVREIGAKACWAEPILSASNQLLGVVTIYLTQTGAPDENDLALLRQVTHLSAIAIERKRIEQQMSYQASYDALTGLPNRRMFNNRLRTEILRTDRSGQKLALLFIDLDHFKEVNDTLGHETGDKLLVDAANRIQHCIRESDTVARLGGDEFVVILPDVGDIPPLERIAEAIIETMVKPFRFGEYVAYISASVGIAVYPQDADNAVTLMSCADQAMYSAKEQGRNSFSFFTHSMQEQAHQRLYLINSLRRALDNGQLEMYFQPIIDVVSGKAVKAEALLRWSHPNLGMVSPEVFIPLAEETNLIQEIGSWVFYRAADMAKRWNLLTNDNAPRKVSINMSPRQLTKGNGEQIAIDYLKHIELDSSCVVIEITEGLLLDNSPDIIEKLAQLRTAGIEISLDDFGTGYSAISYLKKFNLDYLKIDRSFVQDLEINADDRAITEAIVVMAHRLSLKVIAEGVETEGQRALLAAVGCEYIQGYFYSKPLPAEAFLSYVLQ